VRPIEPDQQKRRYPESQGRMLLSSEFDLSLIDSTKVPNKRSPIVVVGIEILVDGVDELPNAAEPGPANPLFESVSSPHPTWPMHRNPSA
jgi:hypothetical protein